MFGGGTGPLRLLNSALGGQVGWLLGFALVSTVALIAVSHLRRRDPRTGWLIAVGGAFLVSAVLFSFASGIFHPYYVSLLAPFLAALVGAGAGELFGRRLSLRVVAPLAIAAGVIVELMIRGNYCSQLHWLAPVLICLGALTVAVLVLGRSARARTTALGGCRRSAAAGARGMGVRHPLLCHQLDVPRRRPGRGGDRRAGLRRQVPVGDSWGGSGPAVPRAPALFGASRSGGHRPPGVGPGGPPPGAGGPGAGGGAPGTGSLRSGRRRRGGLRAATPSPATRAR